MPREESEYLLDMVLAARKAVSFTEGMSFTDFARDERTVFSVTKAVEIVGEAAAQVDRATRHEHSSSHVAVIIEVTGFGGRVPAV